MHGRGAKGWSLAHALSISRGTPHACVRGPMRMPNVPLAFTSAQEGSKNKAGGRKTAQLQLTYTPTETV